MNLPRTPRPATRCRIAGHFGSRVVEVARATMGAATVPAVKSRERTSGFMRLLTVDHGAWMTRVGLKAKVRMYTIGNPLIARTMLEHDIAAALNVPVRLMIYEEPATRTTRVTYDLPSSLI